MTEFIQWFRGGSYYHYHNLIHCMDSDYVTLTIVVLLCFSIFAGYIMIAYRWSMISKALPDGPSKRALNDIKWIFIFCGICGYGWLILEIFWPAWRLYMILLTLLNIFTWRYVLMQGLLEALYSYLKQRDDVIQKINDQQETIDQIKTSKL